MAFNKSARLSGGTHRAMPTLEPTSQEEERRGRKDALELQPGQQRCSAKLLIVVMELDSARTPAVLHQGGAEPG